jgi:CO dehydrogenase maturation factor
VTKLVGFIGKGGTGKSTLTALFLKYILSKDIKPVLVIDADPNSCHPDLLSLKVEMTVGGIRQDLKKGIDDNSISKYDYCDYAINNALIEASNFDMIVMGRTDGPGCYCYVNNVIKVLIEKLEKNYKLILVDCEAGLEHLSRKTLGDINYSFIVSDYSRKGILTSVRQVDLMKELSIKTEKNYLIINNINKDTKIENLKAIIPENDFNKAEFAGFIHNDPLITDFEIQGKSLLDLPKECLSYKELTEILDKDFAKYL